MLALYEQLSHQDHLSQDFDTANPYTTMSTDQHDDPDDPCIITHVDMGDILGPWGRSV